MISLVTMTRLGFAADNLLVNGGFEAKLEGWTANDGGMSVCIPEAARSGKWGLRVRDNSPALGSSCRSARFTVIPGTWYRIDYYARSRMVPDPGIAIYAKYQDEQGVDVDRKRIAEMLDVVPVSRKNEWTACASCWKAPEEARFLTVWIHSFSATVADIDLDDFTVRAVSEEEGRTFVRQEPRVFDALDPVRIKEIASWLPEKPAAPGARITDRAAWDRLAKEPAAAKIIRGAEALLKAPVDPLPDDLYLAFTRNGNRRNYESPYFRRINQLENLVLAECLENKGRFIPAIEARIRAICAERSWVMPAHDASLSNFNKTQLTIDLGSSARGWLLAITADWLRDVLHEDVLSDIRREVERRILSPYRTCLETGALRGNWWIRGENNWNAVCQAGVLGTALTLVEKREERAVYLALIDYFYQFFMKGFTDDGYCSEGMGYWNYGYGHALLLGLTLRNATGGKLDLFADAKNRKVADYACGYQLQMGKSPWFADGGGAPDRNCWALMLQIWPDLVPAEATHLPLLSGSIHTISLRAFGQEPSPPAGKEPTVLPIRTWFDRAQVLICRQPSSAPVPFSLALKGGHNAELHNHNDVGSYTVMLDGLEMAGDPGGEVYTRRTFSSERYTSQVLNSYGHPVPVIGGKLQPAGRRYEARVIRTDFTDASDTCVIDYARAYPVPALTKLERAFRYDRTSRRVTVTDTAAFKEPTSFSVPLITYRTIVPGDTPDTFWLEEGKRKVKVTVTVTGGTWKLERNTIENPSRPSVTRLAVTLDNLVTAVSVTFTYEAVEV